MKTVNISIEIPEGMEARVQKYAANLIKTEVQKLAKYEQRLKSDIAEAKRVKEEEIAEALLVESFNKDTKDLIDYLSYNSKFREEIPEATRVSTKGEVIAAGNYILEHKMTSAATMTFISSLLDAVGTYSRLTSKQSMAFQRSFSALVTKEIVNLRAERKEEQQ